MNLDKPYNIICGDASAQLAALPPGMARCCVTSPPYWGLRDYGVEGQLGLEETPEEYVERIVDVFRHVRRALADDGTLWLNLGDSYNAYNGGAGPGSTLSKGAQSEQRPHLATGYGLQCKALKPKDLIGIPWRVVLALQADGWYLRSDIIWHKPNPMPESVTDRPTKSHEYLFLLSKSARYYYDREAIKEPVGGGHTGGVPSGWDQGDGAHRLRAGRYSKSGNSRRKTAAERGCPTGGGKNQCGSVPWEGEDRNKRSVWTIPTQPYAEAHFATFPEALVEPCVRAGTADLDIVLDPFSGAATTGVVALKLNRRFLGIELNPEYCAMAERRIRNDVGELALEMME